MYELTFFDSSNELALEGASKLSIVLDVLYRQVATIMKLQLCNMYAYNYACRCNYVQTSTIACRLSVVSAEMFASIAASVILRCGY